jgi:TonB family protein
MTTDRYRAALALLALLGAVPAARAADPVPAPASAGVLTRAPELLQFVEADYPPDALAQGLTGDVVLRLTIDATGVPTEVTVEQPAGHGFDEAAVAAAKRFRFRPAEVDGQPAPVQILYKYAFTLEKQAPPPRPTGLLRGELREKGTRAPLVGFIVRIRETGDEAVTDADGHFEVNVPEGGVTLLFDDPEYYEAEDRETVKAGETTEIRYALERRGTPSDEIVVTGKRVQKEVARRTVTLEEIRKIPGTGGDALKVVQNLPGVARAPFGAGLLVIRGSNPGDSGAVIERHFIPLAFHFGGLRSVFNSDLLESIDFYPGNFGAEFGRFDGGIVDVRVRRPRTDRVHGYVEADVFDAGFLVEGPLGEHGAFAAAARRSYIDAILPAVVPSSADLDFVTAPRYYDYQLVYDWKSGRDRVRTMLFGSDDALKFLLSKPVDVDPTVRGNFENTTRFYRLFGQWQRQVTDDVGHELSVSVGRNLLYFAGASQVSFDLALWIATVRDDVSVRLDDHLTLRAGFDGEGSFGQVDVTAPFPPKEGTAGGQTTPLGTSKRLHSSPDFTIYDPSVWAEAQAGIGPVLVVPGVRLDYDSRLDDFAIDPRVNARWAVTDGTTLKGGVGRYMQRPQPDQSDPVFGNPDIGLEHSVHYTAGVEQKLGEAVSLDAQGFYKHLTDVVTRADQVQTLNQGEGRIYGLEVLLRHELVDRLFGWISYTLMRSERKDAPGEPWRRFDFDQTHILTVLAHYKLSNEWEVGARWRYVTGNPQTPFHGGIYDSDADTYVPYPGAINSQRLPAFHQLDLRVDRRWVFDAWILTAYLEIQNAYNRQNPEGFRYNFDYTARTVIPSLPIIPSFGLRGEL